MKMPPDGTSIGYRDRTGGMWFPGNREEDNKPAIFVCEFAGNMVTSAFHKIIAVFEKPNDRDFVIALHNAYLSSDQPDAKDQTAGENNASQAQKCPQCGKDIISPFSKKIIHRMHDSKIKIDDMVFCSLQCASNHQMALEG